MKLALVLLFAFCQAAPAYAADFLSGPSFPRGDSPKIYDSRGSFRGNLNSNPYDPDSIANPYGRYGSPYSPDSARNPFGPLGSPFSDQSVNNPYATDAPRIYDSRGQYRGRLSSNPYDPDSVANPYGRYGSPYSPDSLKNPYGAGSPYGGLRIPAN